MHGLASLVLARLSDSLHVRRPGPADGKYSRFIHASDELLAAAGLYAARKDLATGEWTLLFTVITREARDTSGEVHDRMSVFLERDVWDEWLHPEKLDDPKEMVAMIDATSQTIATTMTTHLVSRAVNNVRTSHPADPATIRAIQARRRGAVGPSIYDQRVIHLEASTHRISSDQTGAEERPGPLLTASAEECPKALADTLSRPPLAIS